ncbi:unnamed protein product, partial [Mycena citricolor]
MVRLSLQTRSKIFCSSSRADHSERISLSLTRTLSSSGGVRSATSSRSRPVADSEDQAETNAALVGPTCGP